MISNVYLEVKDVENFKHKDMHEAASVALKVASKWLTRESIKRIGYKLKIRHSAGRRRVLMHKKDKDKGGVWIGLQPLNIAYIRNYQQTPKGVLSGEHFYKGAFAQAIGNSTENVWVRTSNRRKTGTRKKRSPNGTQRYRKSPLIMKVKEDIEEDKIDPIVYALTLEIQSVFEKAFTDEIFKQYG
ncbi:conserved hypothetical protein [Vibrio chagasii]|nr:conserved hypothetical protein [Vibrio chagasii]